jgi:vacuolar protein sorting-associated protein 1
VVIWLSLRFLISMQACYVNTTHPDFISGHKAMSLVTDRLNANKPQQPANGIDPKTGKLAPGALNNNKDLDVDLKQDDPSFFGSFFARGQKKKPTGASVMEAPPAVIKPQTGLSERETMETEVISKCLDHLLLSHTYFYSELLIHSYFNIVKREMIDMVPKAISLTLVGHAKDDLQRELLQELYKPEVLDDLLKESEFVVNRRREVIGMVQALNKAEEYVSPVPQVF